MTPSGTLDHRVYSCLSSVDIHNPQSTENGDKRDRPDEQSLQQDDTESFRRREIYDFTDEKSRDGNVGDVV